MKLEPRRSTGLAVIALGARARGHLPARPARRPSQVLLILFVVGPF
ncbi:MAG: hypothetical protein MZV63_26910 [Marinilabiliales bacterium]|nr:hypothetical protein [Marinilabiliales bacterium]